MQGSRRGSRRLLPWGLAWQRNLRGWRKRGLDARAQCMGRDGPAQGCYKWEAAAEKVGPAGVFLVSSC